MKFYFFAFTFLLVSFHCKLKAQTFESQILNKEQFKSSASLTMDYDGDGDLDIVLSRSDPAGIYWLENDSTKQFPARAIITDNLPFYIADVDVADFDNDGDEDFLVCFTGVNDGELAWFQRLTDSTYQKWTIATNKDFIEADIGYFDGDSLIDIAAVGLGNSDETCRVYLNQGNLFFTESIVANDVSGGLDVGDLDGDGDSDIALVSIGGINTQTGEATGSRTLINDGNANFSVGKYLNVAFVNSTSTFKKLLIVDLNQDSTMDILGWRGVARSGLMFFDGTDNSPFNAITGVEINNDSPFGDLGGDIVVFDVDNDGLLDIVRQNPLDNRLIVLYQKANFVFEPAYIELNWDNCCNPVAKMSYGDLDDDGDIDLVFPEQGNVDEDVSWYENINGQLFKHQIHGVWDGIRIPKLLDWDDDGDLDVIATVSSGIVFNTEDELILYENIDGKNFINWRLNDALDHAADVEFADIDGDGDMDAFATARDADDLVWLRNDGFEANWVTDTIFPEGNKPLGIAAGDIDDDEDPDVIMCSRDDDKVFGFKNDGLGNFTIFVVDPNVDGPVETEIADLDMDGDMDIAVVCEEGGQSVAIYLNDGSENFTRQILATNLKGTDLEIVNWNNDTIPDIFASFTESGIGIIGFISNGVGGYVADTFSIGNDDILSLKIADVDRDKNLDFVTGHDVSVNGLSHPIFISRTQSGSILENIPLADKIRGEIIGIDVGDIDNDGKLDVVYADFFGDNLVIVDIEDLGNQSTSIHPTALYRRLFRVYPNPSQGKLIIKKDAAANLKWSGYSFFDFSGMLLLDESWNSNREYLELDLKTYVSGYYVLQIKTEAGAINYKIDLD